ncbi:hypothetical protein KFE25_012757 [Diacronema lutheri]|uniref:HTH La-type RNA-binding domain-containing protein n=3 Tax=Diacronema lutheri TaxID=2081491 RepID=A0A8J5X836_DIALT|nr:hypothetical protein KFE25_012757 [Diacronema lutheri]
MAAEGVTFESPDAGSARPAERHARGKMPQMAVKHAGAARARAHASGAGAGAGMPARRGARSAFEAFNAQASVARGGGSFGETYAAHVAVPHLALEGHAPAELLFATAATSPLGGLSPAAAALDFAQLSAAAAAVGGLPAPVDGAELDPATFAAHERVLLKQLVRQQVEYYFSAENLSRDTFLRSQMGEADGRVGVPTIARFNRMRQLSADLALVAEALAESELVDISPQGVRPRVGWQQWLPSAVAAAAGGGGAGAAGRTSPQASVGAHADAIAVDGADADARATAAAGAAPHGAPARAQPPLPPHAPPAVPPHGLSFAAAAGARLGAHAQPVACAGSCALLAAAGATASGPSRLGAGSRRVSPTAASSDSELSTTDTLLGGGMAHSPAQQLHAAHAAAAAAIAAQLGVCLPPPPPFVPPLPPRGAPPGAMGANAARRSEDAPPPQPLPPPPQPLQQPPRPGCAQVLAGPSPPERGHARNAQLGLSGGWSPDTSMSASAPSTGRSSPPTSPTAASAPARAGAPRRKASADAAAYDASGGARPSPPIGAAGMAKRSPGTNPNSGGVGSAKGARKPKGAAATEARVVIEEFVLPADDPTLASVRDAVAAAATLGAQPAAHPSASHGGKPQQPARGGQARGGSGAGGSGGAAHQPAQPRQPQPPQPPQPPQFEAQAQAQAAHAAAQPRQKASLRRPHGATAHQRARAASAATASGRARAALARSVAAGRSAARVVGTAGTRAGAAAVGALRDPRAQAGLVLGAALLLTALSSSHAAQAACATAARLVEGPALSAVWSVLSLRAVCHLWPHLGAALAPRRHG